MLATMLQPFHRAYETGAPNRQKLSRTSGWRSLGNLWQSTARKHAITLDGSFVAHLEAIQKSRQFYQAVQFACPMPAEHACHDRHNSTPIYGRCMLNDRARAAPAIVRAPYPRRLGP